MGSERARGDVFTAASPTARLPVGAVTFPVTRNSYVHFGHSLLSLHPIIWQPGCNGGADRTLGAREPSVAKKWNLAPARNGVRSHFREINLTKMGAALTRSSVARSADARVIFGDRSIARTRYLARLGNERGLSDPQEIGEGLDDLFITGVYAAVRTKIERKKRGAATDGGSWTSIIVPQRSNKRSHGKDKNQFDTIHYGLYYSIAIAKAYSQSLKPRHVTALE